MNSPNIGQVGKVRIGRNKFNIGYSTLGNVDLGKLIPVCIKDCIPSDIFKINIESVIRLQALTVPVLQQIDAKFYLFFTPNRILDDAWEQRITGGEKGEFTNDDALPIPKIKFNDATYPKLYGLTDYFSFPLLSTGTNAVTYSDIYPYLSYYKIYDEFFRDEWLQEKTLKRKLVITDTEIDFDDNTIFNENTIDNLDTIIEKNYTKDYFTAALPEPYKGSPVALPIAGISKADFTNAFNINSQTIAGIASYFRMDRTQSPTANIMIGSANLAVGTSPQYAIDSFNNNTVDLSTASTFDPNDLRTVMQTWKWMERNARAGSRYTEALQARFEVTPQDSRLQRPEFIGSTTVPIIISEVLQTGQPTNTSDRPQGDMAGHGISANRSKQFTYKAQEHGTIMVLMCIEPKRQYTQGIPREFLHDNLYDYPAPEFSHLGEREIKYKEIYMTNNETQNNEIFGFRGIYDEYRTSLNRICGDLRLPTELGAWSLLEIFPNKPQLNGDFLKIKGDHLRNIFEIKTKPGVIYHVNTNITAYRPLPVVAEPGLIDHF